MQEKRENQRPHAAQTNILSGFRTYCQYLRWSSGKGSILNSDKDHRFAAKHVTATLFVNSFSDEAKNMANN